MSHSHKLPSKGRVAVGAVKVAGRFVAGRDLRGGAKTDAGWRRKGTTVLTGTGHATRWAHLPHWQRATARLAGSSIGAATTLGLVVDPAAVAATAQVGAWGAGSWIAYAIGDSTYRYSHRRQYVQPVAEVLGPLVGWPVGTPPASWVSVPHGHREDPDKVVVLRFPQGFALTEAKKKTILGLARPLLGMHGADAEWTPGPDPALELRAAPTPPEYVDLEKARAQLDRASWNEPFLGFTSRSRAVAISLALDSPHVLASYGSGAGKSVLGKSLAAQFRRRGGRVVIIDSVKRGASHKWAKDLDGVTILRSAEAAHDALLELAEEVSDRCELAWHHGEIDRTPLLVIVEESNATANQLQAYWQNELEGKRKSPALIALADVLCVGREAKVHVVSFAQQATAQATGGGAARENYGVRLLSRFTRNTAKMLVPELAPHFPRSSRHPGRAQLVIGGEATEVQTLFLTDEQAREWALGGEPAGGLSLTLSPEVPAQRPDSDGDTDTPANVVDLVPRAHSPLADEPELPESDPLVTLAEAADGMVVGETRVALEQARARARREGDYFPAVRGKRGRAELFRPAELRAWAVNRPGPGRLAGARSGGGEGS